MDLDHVVTFFCDEGEKYINDYFLAPDGPRDEQGDATA